MTAPLPKALYALTGVVYLVAGLGVCAVRTGLLPPPALDVIADVSHGEANTVHVMQEFGAPLVALGVVALWFLRHYERSWPFHGAMTAGLGLFALVHWFDVR